MRGTDEFGVHNGLVEDTRSVTVMLPLVSSRVGWEYLGCNGRNTETTNMEEETHKTRFGRQKTDLRHCRTCDVGLKKDLCV